MSERSREPEKVLSSIVYCENDYYILNCSDNTEGRDTNDEEREKKAENEKENIVGSIRRKTPRWSTAGF